MKLLGKIKKFLRDTNNISQKNPSLQSTPIDNQKHNSNIQNCNMPYKHKHDNEEEFKQFEQEVHSILNNCLNIHILNKGSILYRGTIKKSLESYEDRKEQYWYSLYQNTAKDYPQNSNEKYLHKLEVMSDLALVDFTKLTSNNEILNEEYQTYPAADFMILHDHFFPRGNASDLNNNYVKAINNYQNKKIDGFYRDSGQKDKNEIFILNPEETLKQQA